MSRLLDVAVAEEVFGWHYCGGGRDDGANWQHLGHRRRLCSWVHDLHNALYIVEHMQAQYNLRGTLEAPLRVGGMWTVYFRNWRTEESFVKQAYTLEEAIVRAALLALGVEVDD